MKTALDKAKSVLHLQSMKVKLQQRITQIVVQNDHQLIVDLKLQRIQLRKDIHVADIMMNTRIADTLVTELNTLNSTIEQLNRI